MIVFGLVFFITVLVSIAWASGIVNMKKNYPDYKGEDFLDWDNNHTENNF